MLASEATVKRAGPGFQVEPVSVLQVKGKEKGVPTFRVVGYTGKSCPGNATRRPGAVEPSSTEARSQINALTQHCPNCGKAHDIGVYVSGQQRRRAAAASASR